MAGYSIAIYHTKQQKIIKLIFPKRHWREKSFQRKGHFAHIGNEIKIFSQNKCHHHLSNVCENSFRMFHSNWVISDYHSFVWQFEFPWLNLTNCRNKWMVIRNDPVTVKHTKWPKMLNVLCSTDNHLIKSLSSVAAVTLTESTTWHTAKCTSLYQTVRNIIMAELFIHNSFVQLRLWVSFQPA